MQGSSVWIYEDRPGLDLGGPPGRLVVRFDPDCHGVSKGTSALANHRDAITTPVGGSAVGPVPLASLEPGRYVVRLTLEDKVSKKDVVQEVPVDVVP